MRALNPFTGSFYLETLQVARYTREMYCLFGGRHTHPSTIMPGGVTADITHQTLHRLLRAPDALHRVRQAHRADARRPVRLLPRGSCRATTWSATATPTSICWGCFDDPDYVDYNYRGHDRVGPAPLHHAGPRLQGRADHDRPRRDQPRDPDPARQLVLRRLVERGDVRHARPARQPGRQAPPVEQGDAAQAAEARLRPTSTAGSSSPRMYDKRNDTLRRLRHRRRPVRPPVGDGEGRPGRHRLPEGHRARASRWCCPKTASMPEMELEWKIPEKSNAIERDRARSYHQAYSALVGLHCLEKALAEVRAGRTKSWNDFKVPRGGRQRRLPRGRPRRALAPHGDPRRQDRELPAVPADAVEREPARRLRHAGPLRGRGAEHADLRGERARELQGRRHHAGGPLVRPVPALRRAHVHGRRAGCARSSTRPTGLC